MPLETVAPATKDIKTELAQVEQMRSYRAPVDGQELRLLRGEFHRHTELSYDGESDRPLIDAYCYLIDSAYMDWGGCCDHDNGGGLEYNLPSRSSSWARGNLLRSTSSRTTRGAT